MPTLKRHLKLEIFIKLIKFCVVDKTHSFFDVTGENMNLEVLRTPIALCEGEAITFHRVLSSTSAEQHFIDGEGGDLCSRGLVHNSGKEEKLNAFSISCLNGSS